MSGRSARRLAGVAVASGAMIVATGLISTAEAVPAANGKQVERPYRAFEAGTVQIDLGNCSFQGEGLTCPVSTQSSGKAKHLGKITVSSEGSLTLTGAECILLDGTTPGQAFKGSGEFVAIAANGDELHGTYENTGCAEGGTPPTIGTGLVGSQTITGGTGRFANATGSTTTQGSALGADFDLTANGTISY